MKNKKKDFWGSISTIIAVSTPIIYLIAVMFDSEYFNIVVAGLLVLVLILTIVIKIQWFPSIITQQKMFYYITKKPCPNTAFEKITTDGTRVFQKGSLCSELSFSSLYGARKINYVFIALDVTQNVSLLHFSILGKLRELQKIFFIPIVYVLDDPSIKEFPEEQQVNIHSTFVNLIELYLKGRPFGIVNGARDIEIGTISNNGDFDVCFDKLTLSILSNTTLGEIKEVLSRQRPITDETPLVRILQPIIEVLKVYRLQKTGTAVLCGEDLIRFWEFGAKKIGIEPMVFVLPTVMSLDGTRLNPKNLMNDITLPISNEKLLNILSASPLKWNIVEQIYNLFIFKLPSKIVGDISITTANGLVVNISNIKNFNDIEKTADNLLLLTNDLKERLPCITQIMFKLVSNQKM